MTVAAIILAVIALALALLFGVPGVLGIVKRLPRNRWVGVRSAETMRSDEKFELANRVAGPGLTCAAAVLVMGAVLAMLLGGVAGVVIAAATIAVGVGLAGVIGSLGVRAAAAMPDPASDCGVSGGCTSCSLQSLCATDNAAGGAAPAN